MLFTIIVIVRFVLKKLLLKNGNSYFTTNIKQVHDYMSYFMSKNVREQLLNVSKSQYSFIKWRSHRNVHFLRIPMHASHCIIVQTYLQGRGERENRQASSLILSLPSECWLNRMTEPLYFVFFYNHVISSPAIHRLWSLPLQTSQHLLVVF